MCYAVTGPARATVEESSDPLPDLPVYQVEELSLREALVLLGWRAPVTWLDGLLPRKDFSAELDGHSIFF